MKKLFAVIICIVLLVSCLSFPSTAKGDGSDFILSPSYWFYPGNIYNSLYDDNTSSGYVSREKPSNSTQSNPAQSVSDPYAATCFWVVIGFSCFIFFCLENSNEEDHQNSGAQRIKK